MEHESLKNCHTRALHLAGRLRIPLRSRVWKGQSGEFNGGGTGSSLDFHDHRAYSPGDDPRHINWQAYARTGSYTIKLFREEVRPVVDLILDASDSMFFTEAKATRTAELFYLIAESAQAAGASLTLHAVRGAAYLPLDPLSIRNHRWLETSRAMPAQDPAQPPELSRIPMRSNAIRILLSDLLFPGEPAPTIRHLGQRHSNTIIFAPYLQEEANPAWSGNYEFIDPEQKTHHPHRIEPTTLRRYLDAYSKHFELWKHQTRRHQATLARIPAEGDLSSALFHEAVPFGALETI